MDKVVFVFDEKRIIDAAHAGEAVVGTMGWFADSPEQMAENVRLYEPRLLTFIDPPDMPFRCNRTWWELFYPVSELNDKITFKDFEARLVECFEEVTGWDSTRLGDDGLGADLTLHLSYESAYKTWLLREVALLFGNVVDVPPVRTKEEDLS